MARKFVWVEAQKPQVYPGIAPKMPLLIVKRIFTFGIAGSGTSQMYHKSALARVHNLRNSEMWMNPVISTVSNPCIRVSFH